MARLTMGLSLALHVAGCPNPTDNPCGDCPPSSVCAPDRVCRFVCNHDHDCPRDHACITGLCYPTGSGDAAPGDAAPGDAAPGDAAPGDPVAGDGPAGDASAGDPSPGDPIIELITVVPVYPYAAWNKYIYRSASSVDVYHQPDPVAACAGTETADGWAICIHGGEKRKVVVTSRSSCAGLTAHDALGAFDWLCLEENGAAVFYSRGLRPGHGLADLVTDSGFINQSLTVQDGSTVVAQSSPAVWWSNPVEPLPDNAGGAVLNLDGVDDDGVGPDRAFAPGTILVLAADRSSAGYNLNRDETALVLKNATLTYDGSATFSCSANGEVAAADGLCLLAAGNQSFLWIEGDFNGDPAAGSSAQHAVRLVGSTFLRLRNVTAVGATYNGILLANTDASVLENIRVGHNRNHGLQLSHSTHNRLDGVVAADNRHTDRGQNIYLRVSSDWNTLTRVTSSNAYYSGITIDDSDNNTLSQVTSVNNGFYGLHIRQLSRWNNIAHATIANNSLRGVNIGESSDSNRLTQLVSVNNGDYGVWLHDDCDTHLLTHIVAAHNGSPGIRVDLAADTRFAGMLLLGNNSGGNCFIESGQGTNVGGANCSESDADLVVLLDRDLTTTFLGRANSDSLNADSGSLDSGFLDANAVTDWLHFENTYRAWGPAHALTALDADNRDVCESGMCAIWDWRVSASDTVIRHLHGAVAAAAACPATVHGDEAILDANGTGTSYLEAAIEVIGDAVGDEDGLCESDETCLFAATPGAHQGDHRTSETCTFTDGVLSGVTGVTMLLYADSDT